MDMDGQLSESWLSVLAHGCSSGDSKNMTPLQSKYVQAKQLESSLSASLLRALPLAAPSLPPCLEPRLTTLPLQGTVLSSHLLPGGPAD